MKRQRPSIHRVLMAKRLATKWLSERAEPEYRLTIYQSYGRESRNLPGLLRAFRDGRVRIGSVEPIPDLGVRPEFDHVVVWSRDRQALEALEAGLAKVGLETSGVA